MWNKDARYSAQTSEEFSAKQLSSSIGHRTICDNETKRKLVTPCGEFTMSKKTRSLFFELCRNPTIGPIMSVRAFEFGRVYGLDILVPSTNGSKLSVRVTGCLGTPDPLQAELIRQQIPSTAITKGETVCHAFKRARQNLAFDSEFKPNKQ